MKKFLLLSLIACSAVTTFAQQAWLQGVFTSDSLAYISNAVVYNGKTHLLVGTHPRRQPKFGGTPDYPADTNYVFTRLYLINEDGLNVPIVDVPESGVENCLTITPDNKLAFFYKRPTWQYYAFQGFYALWDGSSLTRQTVFSGINTGSSAQIYFSANNDPRLLAYRSAGYYFDVFQRINNAWTSKSLGPNYRFTDYRVITLANNTTKIVGVYQLPVGRNLMLKTLYEENGDLSETNENLVSEIQNVCDFKLANGNYYSLYTKDYTLQLLSGSTNNWVNEKIATDTIYHRASLIIRADGSIVVAYRTTDKIVALEKRGAVWEKIYEKKNLLRSSIYNPERPSLVEKNGELSVIYSDARGISSINLDRLPIASISPKQIVIKQNPTEPPKRHKSLITKSIETTDKTDCYPSGGTIVPDNIRSSNYDCYCNTPMPDFIDWADNDVRITDQGSCSRCWAEAVVALLENQTGLRLSVEAVMENVGAIGDIANDCEGGGWSLHALQYANKYGVPLEDEYRNNKTASTLVKAISYDLQPVTDEIADVQTLKRLLQNGAIIVTMLMPRELLNADWKSTGVYNYEGGELDESTRHSFLLVGYDDARECFKLKNSFGNWGDHGYIYVAYNDVSDYTHLGAFAVGAKADIESNVIRIENKSATAPLTVTFIEDPLLSLSATSVTLNPLSDTIIQVSAFFELLNNIEDATIQYFTDDPLNLSGAIKVKLIKNDKINESCSNAIYPLALNSVMVNGKFEPVTISVQSTNGQSFSWTIGDTINLRKGMPLAVHIGCNPIIGKGSKLLATTGSGTYTISQVVVDSVPIKTFASGGSSGNSDEFYNYFYSIIFYSDSTSLIAESASTAVDKEVKMPVKVKTSKRLTQMAATAKFDNTKLQFKSIDLPRSTTKLYSSYSIYGDQRVGTITLVLEAKDTTKVIETDALLAYFVFDAIGKANDTVMVEFIDVKINTIDALWTNSYITITDVPTETSNIEILEKCEATVYPNPFDSEFNIKFSDLKPHTVRVYTAQMQLIYADDSFVADKKIDLSRFSAGFYLIQIDDLSAIKVLKQ